MNSSDAEKNYFRVAAINSSQRALVAMLKHHDRGFRGMTPDEAAAISRLRKKAAGGADGRRA